MSRFVLLLVVTCLLAPVFAQAPAAPPDASPKALLHEGSTLVPFRFITEWLGAKVGYNAALREVSLTYNNHTIRLVPDSDTATVDEQTVTLACPAMIRDGRTLVPLRFLAQSLKVTIGWNNSTKKVTVIHPRTYKALALDVEVDQPAPVEPAPAEPAATDAALPDHDGVSIDQLALAGDAVRLEAALKAHPALANTYDEAGYTPLHLAAGYGRRAAVEVLLAAGAEVNARDKKDGWGALHFAIARGYADLAKLLLEKGAMVDLTDNDGTTALHLCATLDRKDLAEILLNAGANPNLANKKGVSPMLIAVYAERKELADLMREHGGKE